MAHEIAERLLRGNTEERLRGLVPVDDATLEVRGNDRLLERVEDLGVKADRVLERIRFRPASRLGLALVGVRDRLRAQVQYGVTAVGGSL